MNILIFSWRGPGHPHAGGAEESTHQHAKGWVKAGHQVILFTSSYPGAQNEEIIDGVKIKRCGSQIFGVHVEAFKWYLFGSHPKFDLVVDQFHGIPFFTPLYVWEKKLAFIHEITKEVWGLNPWGKPFNLIPALVGTALEPLVFKLFYKKVPFMTVSESTKKDLIEWGIPGSNISVVHNGLDVPAVKHRPTKEKKKTLIFLGALSKDKGIESALKTFSIIHQIFSNWQFWVVGKAGPRYLEVLQNQVDKLSLKVKFWGFVSEQKKFELLARAHILINPSIREGWGLVVIEAASMGTPTICYHVPGLRDSVVDGKTGILTKPTPKDLAKGIYDLMDDKKMYADFKNNCLLWSKKFTWKKSTNTSLKLIENIIK